MLGHFVEVRRIRCALLSHRYPPGQQFSWPGGRYDGWTSAFVVLEDEDGHSGVGEIGDGLSVAQVMPALVDQLGDFLIGRPVSIRSVRPLLELSTPGWATGGLVASVVSAVEMAIVDLLGRRLECPATVLLGGAVRDRIPVYASAGLTADVSSLVDELRTLVSAGFRAVKIRLGFGEDADVLRVARAREAVGEDVELLLDLGASYLSEPPSLSEVARLARRLEQFAPGWLEDPLPRRAVASMVKLRHSTSIPLAAGEGDRTVSQVRELLDAGAIDVLQTDAVVVGGVLAQLELAQLAAHTGTLFAPHVWGSGPALMANAAAFACSPNGFRLELPQVNNPLRSATLVEEPLLDHGTIALPKAPGLGVLLPEDEGRYKFDPAAVPVLAASLPPRTS